MKYFIFVMLFVSSIFASSDFLKPTEAFKVDTKVVQNKLNVTFTLGKDIYVYKDRVSINIKNNEATLKNIVFPKSINHDGDDVFTNSFVLKADIYKSVKEIKDLILVVDYQGCSEKGLCYEPMTKEFKLSLSSDKISDIKKAEPSKNETDLITQTFKSGNIGFIVLTFFVFGLLLSLTPCVFPMIPILSSIIVSQGEGMNAKKGFILSLVYVLAMSVAYTMAGVFAGLFGANIQASLQNPWVLSIFATLFVILAFSMFGFFEIGLPSSLQSKLSNSSSKAGDKGGFVGVGIMGFLSALIVGPCVAPPLAGALVYIGQTGDAFLGGLALFVMSLGMGVPLLLVGIGAGKFMPRPGGWMNKVSQVFGVMMLAIAIWMISRIVASEIIMILYSLLLIVSSVYLGAFEPLKGEQRGWNALVKAFGIISFLFGFILFIGFVSGSSSILNPLEKFIATSPKIVQDVQKENKFIKIHSIAELDELLAQNKGKKIMLDFYADWCVSCKELEHTTFQDENVKNALSSYILIQADLSENSQNEKQLSKKYGIFGPPAILFFDENSNEIKSKRVIGYKSADEFLKVLP